VLASNATIIIPAGTYLQGARRIGFSNNTTGAFTVTVKLSNGAGGSTGVGTVLPQGTANSSSVLLYTDGVTDVWPEVSLLGIGALPTAGGTVAGNLAVTGTLTPSQTNGIVGTTTNNNANAGSVGEFVTATASAVSLSSGVAANVTSISLTAGDWDVSGIVAIVGAGTTTFTNNLGGSSSTSATLGPLGSYWQAGFGLGAGASILETIPPVRYSFATTTTVFAIALSTFATSTATASAVIRARRIR
jgi:hypothetical protein